MINFIYLIHLRKQITKAQYRSLVKSILEFDARARSSPISFLSFCLAKKISDGVLFFPYINHVNNSRSLHNWYETSHSLPSSLQSNNLYAKQFANSFTPYFISVAIWQQGLKNLKKFFLTIFLRSQKLLLTCI